MNTSIRLIFLPLCLGFLLAALFIVGGAGFSGESLAAPQACVPGPHSGVLTGTQEWCAVDSPHLLSGNVTIPAGVTLTVEAGVTVQGANGVALLVEGHLDALGTAAQPITFTSSLDTGGAQWAGIGFDGGSGHLRHTTVRYAGDPNSVSTGIFNNGYYRSAIAVQDGTLYLEDVTLRETVSDSYDHGLLIDDSTMVITDTLFTGIGNGSDRDIAMRVTGPDTTLEMNGCTFTGNTSNRVRLETGAMMGHDTTLAAQPVLEGYELTANFSVPPTVTLTVAPGVTIMANEALHQSVIVYGHLDALGTIMQPITFTSATNSGPNQWSGLGFDGGTGHLRHVTVRYAGEPNDVSTSIFDGNGYYRGALAVHNGTLHLEDVTLRDVASSGYDHGLVAGDGHLIITNTLFTAIGDGGDRDAAMRLKGPDTTLEMSGCTFSGNTRDRVLLESDAMMGHDATLAAQPVLEGYELDANFVVPSGVTLSVESGVTVMTRVALHQIFAVEGHLEALGTPTHPITFTSVADSAPGQWPGLPFDGGSGHLRHVTLRYAGERNRVTDALYGPYDRAAIAVHNGALQLENVAVRDVATGNYDYGLVANSSNLIITDSLFTGIGDGGGNDIAMRLSGPNTTLEMEGCTFTGNTRDRVLLDPGAMMSHDATLPAQVALEGYELRQDFTVPPTVTLAVEPGVMVMGASNAELLVEGHLEALGTETKPITFTSATNTGASQWAGIVFDGSQGAGNGHLRHTTVRYGGQGNSVLAVSGDYHSGSNVTVNGVLTGEVRLEHVILALEYHWDGWHAFGDHGLYVNDSHVAVASSIIEDNCDGGGDDSGMYVTGDSTVWIEDSLLQANDAPGLVIAGDTAFVNVSASSIVNNAGDGVRNEGAATIILSGEEGAGNAIHNNTGYGANQPDVNGQIVATYNWWGDGSGPTHAGNPPGTGEEVTDRVLYDPWLTEPPGPPSVATQLVQAMGPLHVSPGDTVNLGLYFNNLLTETLTNTVVVTNLPDEAEYILSTGGGQYWPQRHQVVWQLGDVAPAGTWQQAVQVRFKWGLPLHFHMDYMALVAAENRPNAWIKLAEYRAYTELQVVSHQAVGDAELAAILAADPDLAALYQDTIDSGFLYYGAAQMEQLSDGSERLALVMLNTAKPDERIDLYRDDDAAVAVHTTSLFEEIFTLAGGYRFYYETGAVESWGTIQSGMLSRFPFVAPCAANGCDDFGYNDCLRNCMIRTIRSGQFASHYSSKCAACYATGEQCQQCAWYMYLLRNDTIKNSLDFCYDICDANVDNGKCSESTRECVNSRVYMETPCVDCEYVTDLNSWGACAEGTRCIIGACVPIDDPNVDHHPLETLVAGDPNAMYGPPVAPAGQWISYTIAYENVGQGNAHGVYVVSHLPPELEVATVDVGDGGVFLSGSRTLLWEVGTLGPGAGGEVHFGAQLAPEIPSGTVVVANAVVYFPSVPETTPTNDVVTIVGDVVAYPQQVETVEGTPLAITLSGASPAGGPLTYEILRQPANGALSGTPPNLTYTPAGNFEGMDSFSFRVDDGANSSLPAEVSILITTGAETTPPAVLFTAPADGATGVTVYESPLYDDTYHPVIWAQFTEPLDVATLTNATVYVAGSDGHLLDGVVEYDGTLNRVTFVLNEPLLRSETYTVTITTGVHDTSGNPLATDYVWSFRTEASHIYLPLVIRE